MLIPTPADTFDEWLRLPIGSTPPESPFDVRRARPDEFDRLYDVVDAAFGTKRPRAIYDWLYKKNPTGLARCWILTERTTGAILKTGADYPWPVWRSDVALIGCIGGDAATHPEWQRKGLSEIRRNIRRTHPWRDDFCSISGPNAGSRAVLKTSGRAKTILGRFSGGVAMLRTGDSLAAKGVPSLLARPSGRLADAIFAGWRGIALPNALEFTKGGHRIEHIDRFTGDYDEATLRCMATRDFWCPHNSDFLNWRYLDHPGESYIAMALVENEIPIGYAVLLLDGQKATLSEFAVAEKPKGLASALLLRVLKTAREAGCRHLNFFTTSAWRHWPLFYRAGFIPYPSKNQLEVSCPRYEPEVLDQNHWQIMPGDRDYH